MRGEGVRVACLSARGSAFSLAMPAGSCFCHDFAGNVESGVRVHSACVRAIVVHQTGLPSRGCPSSAAGGEKSYKIIWLVAILFRVGGVSLFRAGFPLVSRMGNNIDGLGCGVSQWGEETYCNCLFVVKLEEAAGGQAAPGFAYVCVCVCGVSGACFLIICCYCIMHDFANNGDDRFPVHMCAFYFERRLHNSGARVFCFF